jgi:hypothetical protein
MNRSMSRSFFIAAMACAWLLASNRAHAGPAVLAMTSQLQYPTVIQGAQDPFKANIYNDAPTGSSPLNFQVTTTYPYPSPYSYSGTLAADGGTSYITLPFSFDSSKVAPANNIPISVTGLNTVSGGSVTQTSNVTVLAHAAPALVVGGQMINFTSNPTGSDPNASNFTEPASGGTEAAASADPAMIGDPPPSIPTAELDLDSITSSGSPYITTTLQPFTDLPSNDDPSQGDPFQLNANAPALGDYVTTFTLNYSDEQDLPGAYAPGSETAYFTVNVDFTPGMSDWTITLCPSRVRQC